MAGSTSQKTPPAPQRPKLNRRIEHANFHSRSSLRDAHADEAPWLHRRGCAHACVRHWSKLGFSQAITQITLTNTMNTKTKIPFGAGFFTGLLLGIGTVVGATEYDGNIEKVFQVSPGGKLIVQADRGSIKVNSTGDEVHIRVLRRVKGGSQAQADELFTNHEVTLKQDGNTVSIIGRNKKDRFRFGSIRQPSLQVRYEISMPRKFYI